MSIKQINDLVLEFLIINGYRDVAANFISEAGLSAIDLDDIENRKRILQHIRAGDVEGAIAAINAVDYYFLDINFGIYFLMLELKLVEMLKEVLPLLDTQPEAARDLLDYSENFLVPLIKQQQNQDTYLRRLEKVLSIVCYPLQSLSVNIKEVLQPEYRNKVAKQVNVALIEYLGGNGTPKLMRTVKTCAWAND